MLCLAGQNSAPVRLSAVLIIADFCLDLSVVVINRAVVDYYGLEIMVTLFRTGMIAAPTKQSWFQWLMMKEIVW